MIHLLESRSHRRWRLNSTGCSSHTLCSNGSAHVKRSNEPSDVSCDKCFDLIVKYPFAHCVIGETMLSKEISDSINVMKPHCGLYNVIAVVQVDNTSIKIIGEGNDCGGRYFCVSNMDNQGNYFWSTYMIETFNEAMATIKEKHEINQVAIKNDETWMSLKID